MIESDWQIEMADVLDWAVQYDGPKFHALLCDPPYELGFMGKDWDRSGVAFKPDTWTALAEHLHPGTFGMAFASARGWHRLAVAIEDAGLRIHPSIFGWAYGSGFPKATRIDTQVDQAAGKAQEILGYVDTGFTDPNSPRSRKYQAEQGYRPEGKPYPWEANIDARGYKLKPITAPATPLARTWQGHRYGLQAMKPALEPIIVFQKPYQDKSVNCITETGAGALWIDGGRIGTDNSDANFRGNRGVGRSQGGFQNCYIGGSLDNPLNEYTQHKGRWPANFCLVHHPECVRVGTRRVKGTNRPGRGSATRSSNFAMGALDELTQYADSDGLETVTAWDCVPECSVRRLGEQSGESTEGHGRIGGGDGQSKGLFGIGSVNQSRYPGTGTAARFFFQADWNLEHVDPVLYCAKASRKERDAGLEKLEVKPRHTMSGGLCIADGRTAAKGKASGRNGHPCVKPIALARWLSTLLLPPPEYAPRRILIPFSGSGSEGIGAGLAGWDEITMIDNEAEYCQIADARMTHWLNQPEQLRLYEG